MFSSSLFNMRGKLKSVYLRVHPDRLNNVMSQDKIQINQNSLAVLNDFVDTVQQHCNDSADGHIQKHVYHMVFYYPQDKRGVVKLRIPKTLRGTKRWRQYAERSVRTIEASLGLRELSSIEGQEEEDERSNQKPLRVRRTTNRMTQSLMRRMGFHKDSIEKVEHELRSVKKNKEEKRHKSRERVRYEDKIVSRVLSEQFETSRGKTNMSGDTKKHLYEFLTQHFDVLSLDSKDHSMLGQTTIRVGRRFVSEGSIREIPSSFRDSDLLDFFRFQHERTKRREERKRRKQSRKGSGI